MAKKLGIEGARDDAPVIILVGAQLGENIGAVARAMLNFGLSDLRLVAPREGWQLERALKASAGAEELIENRSEFATLDAAVADLGFIIATSARPRDMVKEVCTPKLVAQEIHQRWAQTPDFGGAGIVFGCERTGLDNEDISRADILCRVPLNPHFSSLNLAQAVLILAYEWAQFDTTALPRNTPLPDTYPADKAMITGMFDHLEAALEAAGFLAPPEKKPAMMRNIRNMFHRSGLTEQDVRTLRGMINALLRWPRDLDHHATKHRVAAISRGLADPGESNPDQTGDHMSDHTGHHEMGWSEGTKKN